MAMKTNIAEGNLPSMRANYNWTSKFNTYGLLNKLGIGGSKINFKCGHKHYNIKLNGVHVDKRENHIPMDGARLMRRAGNIFYFLFDLSTHGVNKTSRKRGGYYLYTFEMKNGAWQQQRHYYSVEDVEPLNLGELEFYNVFWKILRHCYYGVAIEEDSGGDNSG